MMAADGIVSATTLFDARRCRILMIEPTRFRFFSMYRLEIWFQAAAINGDVTISGLPCRSQRTRDPSSCCQSVNAQPRFERFLRCLIFVTSLARLFLMQENSFQAPKILLMELRYRLLTEFGWPPNPPNTQRLASLRRPMSPHDPLTYHLRLHRRDEHMQRNKARRCLLAPRLAPTAA